MAVSGTQFTSIGRTIHGVGKRLTITAKSETAIVVVKKLKGFIINVGKLGLR